MNTIDSDELAARLAAAMQGVTGAVEGKDTPDPEDKREEADAEQRLAEVNLQKLQAQVTALEEANEDTKGNRNLRDKYATWVFSYLVCYSVFVGLLLLAHGMEESTFNLPDTVLSYLVGSTAASAIGLVLAVTHGLFGKGNSHNS